MDQETIWMPNEKVQLCWSDLSVTLKKKNRSLLKEMNGSVESGQLIAIMGGSGAGKSTLLNALVGKLDDTVSTSGKILFNGRQRTKKEWKKVVGYVEQDDLFHPFLSVQETLEIQGNLRGVARDRVDEVIMELGLDHCRHVRVGDQTVRGISGGERKRLSIGQELLTTPEILFLDEPTSGLDSFTALNLIETLEQLAKKKQKCIVMTIHQPRAELLLKFDKILLLSAGMTLFFGDLEHGLRHFEQLGHPLPKNTNPSDFFLDTLTLDRRNETYLSESQQRIDTFRKRWLELEQPIIVKDSKQLYTTESRTSFSFPILFKRDFTLFLRNIPELQASLGETGIMVALLSSLFYNSQNDSVGIQNKIGILYFMALDIPFMCIMPLLVLFPKERNITKRERATGAYFSITSFFSKFLAHVPFTTLNSLLFSVPIYFLVGLRRELAPFLKFVVTIVGLSVNSSALGLLVGAAIPNIGVGQVVGPLIITLMLLFGGPILNIEALSPVFKWIQYISSITYANKALVQNEFLGAITTCQEGKVCYTNGEMVIDSFGLGNPDFWHCFVYNACLTIGFLIIALIIYERTSRPIMRI